MDRPKRTISKPTRYVTTSSDEAPPSKREKITNPPISTSLQMNKDIDELKRIATEEDNGNTLDNVTDYNNLQNNNPEIRNDDLPLRTYTNTHKSCMNTQQYTNTQPYTTSQLSYSSIQPSNESHSIIQAQPNTHTYTHTPSHNTFYGVSDVIPHATYPSSKYNYMSHSQTTTDSSSQFQDISQRIWSESNQFNAPTYQHIGIPLQSRAEKTVENNDKETTDSNRYRFSRLLKTNYILKEKLKKRK